jgi:AcrR family transcriptional regulator
VETSFPPVTDVDLAPETSEPDWRARAVARSVQAARSRAETRVQRFLDAAFDLIDEKGSTDFTIQEIVDRSKQSLRSFYEYFDGKDDLLLALFEETVHEALRDIRIAVDAEHTPQDRLRAFAVTLYQWCDPRESHSTDGVHRRRALSEFSSILATNHAERVRAALRPQTRLLRELVAAAVDAGALPALDVRRASAQVQLTVMYHAFGNRLAEKAEQRLDAEATWQFCWRGLGG